MYGWSLSVRKLHRKLYCNHFGILGQKEGWLNCNPKLCKEKLGRGKNNTTEAVTRSTNGLIFFIQPSVHSSSKYKVMTKC